MLGRWLNLVFGAFFLGWLVVATCEAARISAGHRTTTAEVRGVSEGKWINEVHLAFKTQNGSRVTVAVDQLWLVNRPKLGRFVDVEYDPDKPTRARIAGQHTYSWTATFCVIALALVGGSGWADHRSRRRKALRTGTG